MSTEPAAARPASTILLLRDSAAAEMEVFMMVRHYQIEFASGALVFPGGSVDAGDRDIIARPRAVRRRRAARTETLSFRIAAIRETFEESGILLARPRGSRDLVTAARAAEIEAAHRVALCEGQASFAEIVASNELVLALDLLGALRALDHAGGLAETVRHLVLLAEAPPEQLGMHDGEESTNSIWLSPREALAGGDSGQFTLPFPTTRNLIGLGKQLGVAAALDDARDRQVVTVMPVMSKDGDKRFLRIPADAGYDGELFEFSGN